MNICEKFWLIGLRRRAWVVARGRGVARRTRPAHEARRRLAIRLAARAIVLEIDSILRAGRR